MSDSLTLVSCVNKNTSKPTILPVILPSIENTLSTQISVIYNFVKLCPSFICILIDERIILATIEQRCYQPKSNIGRSKHNPSGSLTTVASIPNIIDESRYRFGCQIRRCWCCYRWMCWFR